MYQPAHFREDRLEVQHALIRAHPLGLLISTGPDGLLANPVPFTLAAGEGSHGTLRTHVSKANSHWRALEQSSSVLIVFQGADTYITPSWYETKRETGKVVPTWNYAIVQARGEALVIDDPAWLAAQIDDLTRTHETPREAPWHVSDAPADFVAGQIKGIVGIEIPIAAIEGKWKVSQNRPVADRIGVAEGLEHEGIGHANNMSRLVREYGGLEES